jgi:hypothetical protein
MEGDFSLFACDRAHLSGGRVSSAYPFAADEANEAALFWGSQRNCWLV